MLQESKVFMILKEMLKCDPQTQFFLLISESLRYLMRTHFLIIQSLMYNCLHCSNADIHLLCQHSQCDMAVTSHKFIHLVDEIDSDDCVCLAGLRSSTKLSQPARKLHSIFSLSCRTISLTCVRSPSSDE